LNLAHVYEFIFIYTYHLALRRDVNMHTGNEKQPSCFRIQTPFHWVLKDARGDEVTIITAKEVVRCRTPRGPQYAVPEPLWLQSLRDSPSTRLQSGRRESPLEG